MKKTERRILNPKYLLNSLIIFGLVLLCSIFGIILLSDSVLPILRIIFGVVLVALTFLTIFIYGRSCGDIDYKKQIKKETGRSNSFTTIKIDALQCVFCFFVFASLFLLLILIGVLSKSTIILGSVTIVFLPIALVFSLALVSETVSLWILAIYIPYLLLICGAFTAGYMFRISQIRKMRRDIASELRLFNN